MQIEREILSIFKKDTKESNYLFINYNLLISGGILLLVLVLSILTLNSGLIFYFYSLPSFFWSGVIPGFCGILFIIILIIQIKKISIKENESKIECEIRKIWKKENYTFNIEEIDMWGVFSYETKFGRWAISCILLQNIIGVHFIIGIKLLGFSHIAYYLISYGVIALLGLLIYLLCPRRMIFLKSNEMELKFEIRQIFRKNLDQNFKINCKNNIRERIAHYLQIKSNILWLSISIFLLIFGIVLIFDTTLYFGEFTSVLVIIFGIKYLQRNFDANYMSQRKKKNNNKNEEFMDNTYNSYYFETFSGNRLFLRNIDLINSPFVEKEYNLHPIELIFLYYCTIQSVKYIFRDIWVKGSGISYVYLIIGVILLSFSTYRLISTHKQIKLIEEKKLKVIVDIYPNKINAIGKLKFVNRFKNQLIYVMLFIVSFLLPFILYPLELYYLIL